MASLRAIAAAVAIVGGGPLLLLLLRAVGEGRGRPALLELLLLLIAVRSKSVGVARGRQWRRRGGRGELRVMLLVEGGCRGGVRPAAGNAGNGDATHAVPVQGHRRKHRNTNDTNAAVGASAVGQSRRRRRSATAAPASAVGKRSNRVRSRRRRNRRRRGSGSSGGSRSAASRVLNDPSIATVSSAVAEMKVSVTCSVVIVSCDTAIRTAAEAAVIHPATPARRLRLGWKQRRGNATAYAKGRRSADTKASNAPADPSAIADSHRVERN